MFKQVGDYELKNRIGRGNYADVYLGVHVKTREQYAIKVIAKEKFSHPKLIAGLESEVKIMKEFNHRNLLSLKKYFSSANNFYLVMEYCAGGDLNKFIKKVGRLREEHAFNFLAQLAEGIAFLNEQGFIHRDLKTANVLLTEETVRATLKIADFGFARQLQSDALAQTPCGTPLYMAPEVLAAGQYDAKADIWSIGCIFYEMLAGQVPFGGVNETDLLNNIRTKELRAPADVSPVSISILRRLLEKSIPNRASIQDLLQVCQHIHRLSQSQQPSAQAASMLPPTSGSGMAAATAAAVAAVAAGAGAMAASGSGTSTSTTQLTASALAGSELHPAGGGGSLLQAAAAAAAVAGARVSDSSLPGGVIIAPAGDGSAAGTAAPDHEKAADPYSAADTSHRSMSNASQHRTPSIGGAPATPPSANKLPPQSSPPSHHPPHPSSATPQPLQLQPPQANASAHAYANAAHANAQGHVNDSTYDDYEMVDAGASGGGGGGSSGLRLTGHGPGGSAMSPIPPTPAYQPLPAEPVPANSGQYPAPINTSYPYAQPQPYAQPSLATHASPYPPPPYPTYPPPPYASLPGPTTVAGLFPAASSSSQDNGDLFSAGQPQPLYPSLPMPTASQSPNVTPRHQYPPHAAYPAPPPSMTASQYQQNLQAMAQLVQQQQQQQQQQQTQQGYLMPPTASPGTTPPTSTTTASFIQYQDLYQRSMIQRWEVLGHIVHVVAQTTTTTATTAATATTTRGAPSPTTAVVWTYAIETPDQLSVMLSALALYLHALALVKTFLVAVELPDDVNATVSSATATNNNNNNNNANGNAPLSTTPTGTGLLAAANNPGGGGGGAASNNPGIDAGWVLLHRLRGDVTGTFLALTQRADQCVYYLQQCTTTSTAGASGLGSVGGVGGVGGGGGGGGGAGGGGATPSVPSSTTCQAAAWKASLPRAEALMLQEALRQEQDAEMEEMLGHLDRAQHLYEAARHLLVGVSLTFAEDTVDVRKQVQHTLKSLMDALEHKIALCKQRSSVVGRYGLLSESMAVGSVGAAGVGEA
eukprot:gene8377-6046_t